MGWFLFWIIRELLFKVNLVFIGLLILFNYYFLLCVVYYVFRFDILVFVFEIFIVIVIEYFLVLRRFIKIGDFR